MRRRQHGAAAVLLAPFFLVFAAVLAYPIGYAAWMSLFSDQATSGLGFGGTETVFVGLGNFGDALTDPVLQRSFGNIARYFVIYVPVMFGGAVAFALLLDSVLARAKRLFQLAVFMPYVVPAAIATLIWGYLYNPALSPLSEALSALGIHWRFLDSPAGALLSLSNLSTWMFMGFNTILLYAALQAVPREMIEAATVDGAGELRTALQVKLPMIRPAAVVAMLFTVIGSVQLFTQPRIFAQDSPAIDFNWSPVMFIQNAALERHNFGLAAATSLVLILVLAVLSYLVTRLGNRWRSA